MRGQQQAGRRQEKSGPWKKVSREGLKIEEEKGPGGLKKAKIQKNKNRISKEFKDLVARSTLGFYAVDFKSGKKHIIVVERSSGAASVVIMHPAELEPWIGSPSRVSFAQEVGEG